ILQLNRGYRDTLVTIIIELISIISCNQDEERAEMQCVWHCIKMQWGRKGRHRQRSVLTPDTRPNYRGQLLQWLHQVTKRKKRK
ncbi:hypothetical protein C0J52_08413, partial [Blattella germanica]